MHDLLDFGIGLFIFKLDHLLFVFLSLA
jgi:hypothetical protein